jgi:hypothetical protein
MAPGGENSWTSATASCRARQADKLMQLCWQTRAAGRMRRPGARPRRSSSDRGAARLLPSRWRFFHAPSTMRSASLALIPATATDLQADAAIHFWSFHWVKSAHSGPDRIIHPAGRKIGRVCRLVHIGSRGDRPASLVPGVSNASIAFHAGWRNSAFGFFSRSASTSKILGATRSKPLPAPAL